jgi:hypothetical protein
LNRPAVFAALLATGDEAILARLGALRLLFDADETSRIRAQFVAEQRSPIVEFLTEWRAL